MSEQLVAVGPVELCYETFGEPGDPAVLLIMGLGTRIVGWRPELIAAKGFFVIRYDNRDVGRSTHFSTHRPLSVLELVTRRPRRPAYTLDDMADDAAGLLAALGIDAAHVVGASMGGMIAQTVAARHPGKVRSLVSIMSTTGAGRVGRPGLKAVPFLLKAPAKEREERSGGSSISSTSSVGNRERALRTITAPTLVIHGTDDKMVAPSGGRTTAKQVPNARLELIRGMGHDQPRGAWEQIVGLITGHARTADGRAASLVPT